MAGGAWPTTPAGRGLLIGALILGLPDRFLRREIPLLFSSILQEAMRELGGFLRFG
jgi:hypothetical protein